MTQRAAPCEPAAIVIECKQSRGDFLRDSSTADELLRERRELNAIRKAIEEQLLRQYEPDLRRNGSSLFAELDQWDFAASRSPGYRQVLLKLKRIEQRLYGETKFHLLHKYKLADRMYIAAPRGMVKRSELPTGWGLLECPAKWLDDEAHDDRLDEPPMYSVAVEAPVHGVRADHRQRWLRNIAVAASYAAFR